MLEKKCGKLITLKPPNDDNGIVDKGLGPLPQQQKFVKQLQDITDEEGFKRTYETTDSLYQHYNKLFMAWTKDIPQDHIDDLKISFDNTLNKTHTGRTADAYYRSHHELDTAIGHPLGGAIALSLEEQYKKECNNPFGIVQSKIFCNPTVSGNIKSPLLKKYYGRNARCRCCWYGIYRCIC